MSHVLGAHSSRAPVQEMPQNRIQKNIKSDFPFHVAPVLWSVTGYFSRSRCVHTKQEMRARSRRTQTFTVKQQLVRLRLRRHTTVTGTLWNQASRWIMTCDGEITGSYVLLHWPLVIYDCELPNLNIIFCVDLTLTHLLLPRWFMFYSPYFILVCISYEFDNAHTVSTHVSVDPKMKFKY